jgi:sRNA-binding carbon storage regulator CsrA
VFPPLGISIEVRRITHSRVQLAISAPAKIPVYRQEVLERQSRELANYECSQFTWSI